MNRPLLPSTLREMQRILSSSRLWLVFSIVVVLFAVTGPFGTFDRLPFHARLGYWLSIHALAFLTAIFCSLFFNLLLTDRLASVAARVIIGAAFAAVPIGFIAMALTALFLGADISVAAYGANLVNSVPVSIAVSLIVHFALDGTDTDPQPEAAASSAREPEAVETGVQGLRPKLLDRIPLAKRGALIRLEVEDHYVRAITDRGSEMLLMRLADAIAEAGDGRQAHRSHWVSATGAQALEREPGKNGKLYLLCADGARVPVSRSHAAVVQAWMREIGRFD